jgi:hypothetical protein
MGSTMATGIVITSEYWSNSTKCKDRLVDETLLYLY